MPSFNRRGFLQLASAAGVAPLLPALSAPAVAATAKGSISKALWTSLYAHSGSASKFVNVAQNMGLPNAAIQGVSARSIGVKVAMSAAAPTLQRSAVASQTAPPNIRFSDALETPRKLMQQVNKSVQSKTGNPEGLTHQDTDLLETHDGLDNDSSEP